MLLFLGAFVKLKWNPDCLFISWKIEIGDSASLEGRVEKLDFKNEQEDRVFPYAVCPSLVGSPLDTEVEGLF